jgi:hypothetical protein
VGLPKVKGNKTKSEYPRFPRLSRVVHYKGQALKALEF